MSRRSFGIAPCALSLSLTLAAPLGGAAPAAAAEGSVAASNALMTQPFTRCRLTDALQLRSVEAECASISVAETTAADGRRIELAVARIPAISSRPASDPLVLLAGGPGQGAQQAFMSALPVFARANRERDILLIDQRGTGQSQPLNCELPVQSASDMLATDTEAFVLLSERCLEGLQEHTDPAAYTTSQAVQDLEAVRALLGYKQLSLYAGSYGTRVAQHYARRYPERVRSMVLDGVIAPDTVLGPRLSLDAQVALDGIWQRCAADIGCNTAFGDVAGKTRLLLQRLREAQVTVTTVNPASGQSTELVFGAEQLAVVLRLASYEDSSTAMLPLLVSEAAAGNYGPVASLFQRVAGSLQDTLALGMHNSVICSEDEPRYSTTTIDRAAVAATYLGTSFLDALPRICARWPRGQVDADFHALLTSTIPTLLLSGSLDPATPPADADRVLRGLTQGRHLVFDGAGHGQLGLACMDRVLAAFYALPDPQALDTSCLDRRLHPPFWVSLAGPAP